MEFCFKLFLHLGVFLECHDLGEVVERHILMPAIRWGKKHLEESPWMCILSRARANYVLSQEGRGHYQLLESAVHII